MSTYFDIETNTFETGLWIDGSNRKTRGTWRLPSDIELPTPAVMTESFKVVESHSESFHNSLVAPDWEGSYAMDMWDTGSGLMQMITVD